MTAQFEKSEKPVIAGYAAIYQAFETQFSVNSNFFVLEYAQF
jgi:hypothetical protein